jgi:hypothetical protein
MLRGFAAVSLLGVQPAPAHPDHHLRWNYGQYPIFSFLRLARGVAPDVVLIDPHGVWVF